MSGHIFKQLIYIFPSGLSSKCTQDICHHHDGVQLLLDGLICALVVLIWIVHRKGLSEKQRGISTHLEIRSLKTPNEEVKPE